MIRALRLLFVLGTRRSGHPSPEEDARDDLEDQATEDDEAEEDWRFSSQSKLHYQAIQCDMRTEPDGRDGRLGQVLGALFDLVLRLAAARLLVFGELEVCPSLLRCLRLQSR